MSKTNHRNMVAADMGSRYKSKKFTNDRSNRRGKDARNTKAYLDEIIQEDLEIDLETEYALQEEQDARNCRLDFVKHLEIDFETKLEQDTLY